MIPHVTLEISANCATAGDTGQTEDWSPDGLMFLALARYDESAALHMDKIYQDGQYNMTWRDMMGHNGSDQMERDVT